MKPSALLIVSVHDVAPATYPAAEGWSRELIARGVPASLLVIPGPWRGRSLVGDLDLCRWLHDRKGAGDEIVQHGWEHRASGGRSWRSATGLVLARGAAEFGALDEAAARWRLRAGRLALERVGLSVEGFTAPGWLHSPGTITALRALGFRYTTTHTAILDLDHCRRVPGLALSHRPSGRTQWLAARLLAAGTGPALRSRGLTRIALHPADLEHDELRRLTLVGIDRCLAAGLRPVTYATVLSARDAQPR
jgi:predicted deacetylase